MVAAADKDPDGPTAPFAGRGSRKGIIGPYACDHPIALWLTHVSMAMGFLIVLSPEAASDSGALEALPIWAVVIWGISFFAGGFSGSVGLLTARAQWEAAGMALLASNYWTAVFLTAEESGRVLATLFLFALAAGTTQRAITLVRR